MAILNCLRCNNRAIKSRIAQRRCVKCFSHLIEQRVRRTIRIRPRIIKLVQDGCLEGVVTEHISRKIFRAGIKRTRIISCETIVPWSADKEAAFLIETMLIGKRTVERGIKLLRAVLREECELYAKSNNLKYKVERNKNAGDAVWLVRELERISPGARFALIKYRMRKHGRQAVT